MRKQCLDELGVGWLVQALNGEPSKPAMGTSNAAGEQVDLLNSVDEPDMDLDEELSEEEDEDTMADSIPPMSRLQRPGSRYTSATNIRDRLQQIKNDEQDTRLINERDDIRIQEQALDFLRNFIAEDQATGEMIDHLLKAFGHSRLFEILDTKIRPKNSTPITSQQPQASSAAATYWPNTAQRVATNIAAQQLIQHTNWNNYPAPELVLATTYVLVHLANGRPAHRSLLISQTSLMQHILPLCTHPRREVRSAWALFLNNLLWLEDSSDEAATRERAQLLKNLGFEEGAKLLAKDMDLDVRERVKPVIDQFARLLGEAQGMGRSSVYGSASGSVGQGQGQGFGGGGDGGMSGLGRLGGLHGWDRGARG
jgi:hypothetical protein